MAGMVNRSLPRLLVILVLGCGASDAVMDDPDAGAGGQNAGAGGAGGAAGTGGEGGTDGTVGTCDGATVGPPLAQCAQLSGTCGGCMRGNICDQFTAKCAPNADCVCMAQCIAGSGLGGVTGCLGSCGLQGSPPGFSEMAKVLAVMCPDTDECSAPAAFTPPPDSTPPPAPSGGSIGGGTLPDCSFDPGLRYDPNGSILQLESSDGSICVRIDRRNDGAGALANTSFTLLDMIVGPLGQACHTSDPSTLGWYSSHHNFDDWAHSWCGNRHYDVSVALSGHGAMPTYKLHVFEGAPIAGGACPPGPDGTCPISAPIDLVPVP